MELETGQSSLPIPSSQDLEKQIPCQASVKELVFSSKAEIQNILDANSGKDYRQKAANARRVADQFMGSNPEIAGFMLESILQEGGTFKDSPLRMDLLVWVKRKPCLR